MVGEDAILHKQQASFIRDAIPAVQLRAAGVLGQADATPTALERSSYALSSALIFQSLKNLRMRTTAVPVAPGNIIEGAGSPIPFGWPL